VTLRRLLFDTTQQRRTQVPYETKKRKVEVCGRQVRGLESRVSQSRHDERFFRKYPCQNLFSGPTLTSAIRGPYVSILPHPGFANVSPISAKVFPNRLFLGCLKVTGERIRYAILTKEGDLINVITCQITLLSHGYSS
jgi:hypothetical protein